MMQPINADRPVRESRKVLTKRKKFYLALAERLKLLREAHGYSELDIAIRLGIEEKIYARHEQAEDFSMDLWRLIQIANIYNVGITTIVPPHYNNM